jgi:hypothetical protein
MIFQMCTLKFDINIYNLMTYFLNLLPTQDIPKLIICQNKMTAHVGK